MVYVNDDESVRKVLKSERAQELGAKAFFTKPFDGQALVDAIY